MKNKAKERKSGGKFLFEIFEMMNKPTEFFKKDLSLLRGAIYFISASLIFTYLTQTLIFYGVISSVIETSFFLSIVINFLSILAGFGIIAAIIMIFNGLIGGKDNFQVLSVLLYSISPVLMLEWVPFIFLQFIMLFWSLAMIMIGIREKEKFSYRKSLIFPILFIILLFILTYISRNYIILGWFK